MTATTILQDRGGGAKTRSAERIARCGYVQLPRGENRGKKQKQIEDELRRPEAGREGERPGAYE